MAADPERHQTIVEALAASSFDALVCSSPTEVLLLTGYWPVMGVSVALFSSSGDVCILVPEDETDLAQSTSSARLIPYQPARLDQLTTPAHALRPILESTLQSMKLTRAHIGAELLLQMQPATYSTTVRFNSALEELLIELAPAAKLDDCGAVLEPLKAKKTANELELIGKAAAMAASGFAKSRECARAGVREIEVAAAALYAFETSDAARAAHRHYGFFYCMSGPNSAEASSAYARTRQRTIQDGDLILVHANTCADGYWTDITRTCTAGEEQDRHKQIRTAIEEARQAALSAIRPGARASEVDGAARRVMERHGFGRAFRHSTGHGVGFAAANPNGYPRIHPNSPDVLEEGMTFNVEPAAYFDGYGGMRHCDMVAVTQTGAKVLTEF